MADIKLLDCTLRDGGYVNDWEFGQSTATYMFNRLVCAGMDIIEIGFLDDRRPFDINRTIQPTTACYDKMFAGCRKGNTLVTAMIDYGTCDISNLGPCEDSFIDGIRIIFKKPKMKAATAFAKEVKKLGYKVFLNLVSITSYEDRDMLDLIDLINDVEPYTVSMVDTYGLMHKEEMLHYFQLLDHNLTPGINIAYHSHNNFQLGYANEIEMLKQKTERCLIIDGTVYGMGKSAGNAPLELLAMHLNENYGGKYDLDQILEIIDVNIMRIYKEHYWGYSLQFFLAASNDCHPNYIKYLLDKHTLSVKDINDIAGEIEEPLRLNYDKEHIERLYQEHQKKTVFEGETVQQLQDALAGKEVLMLGPGNSISIDEEQIKAFIEEQSPVVITVNCIPTEYQLDYAFIGNSKRYTMLYNDFRSLGSHDRIIATSNISSVDKPFRYVFSYEDLRDPEKTIEDNSFIMALKALRKVGVRAVTLAGFDGFFEKGNYYDDHLDFAADYQQLKVVNDAIRTRVHEMKSEMDIVFLTKSLYE